ncbi:MAG: hypothetical protein GY756_22300, partial [bacterium]|nr:hypothetical protein [bacterium]
YQIQASTYFGENSFLVDGLNIDMSNLGYNNTATNTNKYDPHDLYRYWFKNYTD